MADPNFIENTRSDPEFQKLSSQKKLKIITNYFSQEVDTDPEFKAASAADPNLRAKVWNGLYNDMTTKPTPPETTPSATPEEIAAAETQGAVNPFPKDVVAGVKKAAMPYVRPALEYGGMTAGGLLGGAGGTATMGPVVGTSVGAVTGAGLGYGAGKGIADYIEGVDQPQSVGESLLKGGADVATGAAMDAGGAVLGKGIMSGGEYLANSQFGNWAAKKLYGSAIKIPTSAKWTRARGEAGDTSAKMAIQKGLKEQVPPSEMGLLNAGAGKEAAGASIDSEVASMNTSYSSKDVIDEGLQRARDKATKSENPIRDMALIDEYISGISHRFRTPGQGAPTAGRELSPTDLNELKKELYTLVNFDKASGGGSSLLETMRKGISHEAMSRLVADNPALKGLNSDYASWKLLEEAISNAVARNSGKDIVDLGTKILVHGSPSLAVFNAITGAPAVKARLAFMIKNAGRLNGGTRIISRPVSYLTTPKNLLGSGTGEPSDPVSP